MKFSYHATMCPVDQYEPLAIAVEELGYDTFTLPDSIFYPQEGSDVYPYNDDGTREFLDGVPFIEPFVIIPYLAAITKKLRFTTSVYKLAVHQPVTVAKRVTSLGIMTNNRFGFGVGISPWPEDFLATQTPWEKRGKRLDEMMDIINGLSTGEYFGYEGEIFNIEPLKMCPVPSQRVPLLVGGHAKPALRRAARLGDGWISAGCTFEEIEEYIGTINEFRKEYGRDHLPFENHVMTEEAYSVDGLKKLESIGVTEVIIGFRDAYKTKEDNLTVPQKIDQLKWYADTVMKPYRES